MRKILLVFFGVVNVALLVMIVWCYRELRFGSAETTLQREKEKEIARYERVIKSFDEKKIFTEHASYIQRIPADMAIPLSAIKTLRQWAAELNFENIRFAYDPKEVLTIPGFDRLRVVPFRVIMSGTYDAIMTMIERLPTADILIIPISVEMKRGDATPLITVTFSAHTYTVLSK